MNILIVNNGTKHIKELKEVLSNYNVSVINRNQLPVDYFNSYYCGEKVSIMISF